MSHFFNTSTSIRLTPDVGVCEAPHLTLEDLRALLLGRIYAIRVPGFCPTDMCADIAGKLMAHPRFGYYANAGDVGRVGHAFYESIDDPALRELYYAEADVATAELRAACAPHGSPFDRFVDTLVGVWPEGARRENLDGRDMFAGLTRVFEAGSEALPHVDVLSWDAPDAFRAHTVRRQLAANVYLQTSTRGGELELWDVFPDRDAYADMRLDDSYGLDRELLGAPVATITPRAGELILFDSTRVHAVRPAEGRPRVTMSCFIAWRRSQPLTYWS